MYSNAQILSAVLVKWLEPAITQFGGGKIMSIPALAAIQNKIRSTGWVSQNWSIAQELSPIINKVGGRVVEPIITNMISNYPDAELPRIAHDVVDAAIENGGMNLFEGNLSFDAEDLRQLKKLLDYNLPVSEASGYEVKTQP